jgi:hypothetical protein
LHRKRSLKLDAHSSIIQYASTFGKLIEVCTIDAGISNHIHLPVDTNYEFPQENYQGDC